MRFFRLLPMMLFLVDFASSSELYLSGENRLEYWRRKETQEEFFEDKLDVEAIYGDFLGGTRYYLYQSSQADDPKRQEGISRLFLEWRKDPFQIRAGTFYSIFGRGLLLAAYEDDQVKLDQDLKGFKGSVLLPKVDLTILSGRPRNVFDYRTINDTTDLIRGADINFRPLSLLSFGAGWVRLNQLDRMPPPDTSRSTEVYGGRGELVWNWFNLYGEYGRKEGWDRIAFAEGEGEGYYLSSSISLPGVGLSAEYCDYDSLAYGGTNYRYNNPPCSNRYGKAINSGADEKGYHVSANLTPWEPLLTAASYAELRTHDDTTHAMREVYGELKLESFERGSVRLSVDRLEETIKNPFFIERIETAPLLETRYHITRRHTIGCSYRHRISSDTTQFVEKEKWQDRRATLSYSYAPHLTLTLTAEDTNRETDPGEDTSWRSAALDVKLGETHDISLIVGSQKGEELVCSGGVCRSEPPFKGWKLLISSRF